MSSLLERWKESARLTPQRLVLAEAGDERVFGATRILAQQGIARVTLVTPPGGLHDASAAQALGRAGVVLVDAGGGEEIARTAAALTAARGDRLAAADREVLSRDPLFQAAARVREGLADCLVAGASRTTSDVLRAALWLIGLAPGTSLVSSFFVMVIPASASASSRTLVFADCGVVPDPDARQLAEIGVQAAEHFERLIGETRARRVPVVLDQRLRPTPARRKGARGGAARACLAARSAIEGELQADAALDPDVARRKAPGSAVAGRANVLVFPDLDSGNIGYKLVQRLAGAAAYGPILMGLRAQANDLSRGCSVEDVVQVSLIACTLAARSREPGRA